HPPFQIDGNFAATAGIAEMLLQSHQHFLHFLPALPEAWPDGFVRGLRARGGFEINLTWQQYQIVLVEMRSLSGETCTLFTENPLQIEEDGRMIHTEQNHEGLYQFNTVRDGLYRMTPKE